MSVHVVMYASRWCGFCMRARKLLEARGVAWREVDVTDAGSRDEMTRRSGKRTVPQIFIDDTHVGGYEDLYALERAGGLDTLINKGVEHE